VYPICASLAGKGNSPSPGTTGFCATVEALAAFAGVDPQAAFSELVLVALVFDGKLFRSLRFGEEDDIDAGEPGDLYKFQSRSRTPLYQSEEHQCSPSNLLFEITHTHSHMSISRTEYSSKKRQQKQ
jgi:hypothetical protein